MNKALPVKLELWVSPETYQWLRETREWASINLRATEVLEWASKHFKARRCKCGCGKFLTGKQQFSSSACRKRWQRKKPSQLSVTPRHAKASGGRAKPLDVAPRAKAVAALCVSGRSIYKHLPGVVAYDRKRDARTFDAKTPAVAHPPCRHWSKFLSHQAKSPDRAAEMEIGRWCVRTVMRCGGVVEQPADSRLWQDMNLPVPNAPARDGCYTIYVEQRWFGYPTRKPTWLLICGVPIDQLPPVPFSLQNGQPCPKPGLSSFARSRTMNSFAEWLVSIARRAKPHVGGLGTAAACKAPDAPRRQNQAHDGRGSTGVGPTAGSGRESAPLAP